MKNIKSNVCNPVIYIVVRKKWSNMHIMVTEKAKTQVRNTVIANG